MNHVIRQGKVDEVPEIVALRRSMFEAMGHEDAASLDRMSDAFARYCREHMPTGDFRVWVAENEEGRPIASIGLVVHGVPPSPSYPEGVEAYIMDLVTLPAYRRRGIAAALLDAALDTARSEGIPVARLHATDDGRAIYERAGFQKNETVPEMWCCLRESAR